MDPHRVVDALNGTPNDESSPTRRRAVAAISRERARSRHPDQAAARQRFGHRELGSRVQPIEGFSADGLE